MVNHWYVYGFDRRLQVELATTQVLDRAAAGRIFFDQLIRDNLDIGRPDKVRIVFDRQIRRRGSKATPGSFRTQVITTGASWGGLDRTRRVPREPCRSRIPHGLEPWGTQPAAWPAAARCGHRRGVRRRLGTSGRSGTERSARSCSSM
jgi:hypothetical protein